MKSATACKSKTERVFVALQHKCYIVATCDRDLKRRIRKVWFLSFERARWSPSITMFTWATVLLLQVPGVPIMYITQHRYSIERLPEATIGGGTSCL